METKKFVYLSIGAYSNSGHFYEYDFGKLNPVDPINLMDKRRTTYHKLQLIENEYTYESVKDKHNIILVSTNLFEANSIPQQILLVDPKNADSFVPTIKDTNTLVTFLWLGMGLNPFFSFSAASDNFLFGGLDSYGHNLHLLDSLVDDLFNMGNMSVIEKIYGHLAEKTITKGVWKPANGDEVYPKMVLDFLLMVRNKLKDYMTNTKIPFSHCEALKSYVKLNKYIDKIEYLYFTNHAFTEKQ